MADKPKSQADKRRSIVAKDQWGRPWLMNIELETGDPTGAIVAAGWTDPLRTPQKYLKVPKDEYDQPIWGRCLVDIIAWLRDATNQDNEWERLYNEAGRMAYKNKFNPADREDGFLLELAGPRAWPSPKCLSALMDGNKALLGLVPLDAVAKRLMGGIHTGDVDPEIAKREQEFARMEREAMAGVGVRDTNASMAPEEAPIPRGTSKQDFELFMAQSKDAGIAYPAALNNWRLHKELVEEAETATS